MTRTEPPRLFPLSESAFLIQLGDTISGEVHNRVRALVAAIDKADVPGLIEVVPAYASLAVHYDPAAVDAAAEPPSAVVERTLQSLIERAGSYKPTRGRLVEVPVRYGGTYGPDLPAVADRAGLSEADVIRMHSKAEYTVAMLGFSPGFAYLLGLPERLATPRHDKPRLSVPAGSVGIAGAQTGIYSLATPGGWRIIGRTPARLFDPVAEPPTLLSMGDRVRFSAEDG
jgi:inhibitor of KinA